MHINDWTALLARFEHGWHFLTIATAGRDMIDDFLSFLAWRFGRIDDEPRLSFDSMYHNS